MKQLIVFTECQAILTQLIFEHALRIRVKAEASDQGEPVRTPGTGSTTAVATPDNASTAEPEGATSSPSSNNGDTPEPTTKQKDTKLEAKEEKAEKKRNLVGKLNNLVTSDLDSLQGGQMFMMLGKSAVSPGLYILTVCLAVFSVPSQVGFSAWFLYTILGWA